MQNTQALAGGELVRRHMSWGSVCPGWDVVRVAGVWGAYVRGANVLPPFNCTNRNKVAFRQTAGIKLYRFPISHHSKPCCRTTWYSQSYRGHRLLL